MRKNPGRKEYRNLIKRRRCMRSDKKQAINERNMLWFSKYGPDWKIIREMLKKNKRGESSDQS